MYPPRRTGDSSSKPKTGYVAGSYSSPPHKDLSKVNKILENAKKYQQAKQYKRDYMLEGIMNLNRKPADQEGLPNKGRRQSQLSNSSNKGDENKKDIYRRVDNIDAASDPTVWQSNSRRGEGEPVQSPGRQVIRNSTGNYQTSTPQSNFQTEHSRKKGYTLTQHQQTSNSYKYSSPGSGKNIQMNVKDSSQSINSQSTYQYQGGINQNSYNSILGGQPRQQKMAVKTQKAQNDPTNVHSQNRNELNKPANESIGSILKEEPLSKAASDSQLVRRGQQSAGKVKLSSNVNFAPTSTNYQSTSLPSYKASQERQVAKELDQQPLNPQSEEEKRQIMAKNNKDQYSVKKLESVQPQKEQKNYIKFQMEKLTQEAVQMRNKFYKAEEERNMLNEKCRLLEKETQTTRSENEQLKLKLKNIQFEVNSLYNSKSLAENQLKQLKTNKESVYDEVMGKMQELNIELRKKSLEVTKLERTCSQLQGKVSEGKYQIYRMNEVVAKKQEEVLRLQEKLYQVNKLNSAQSRAESQIKNYADKLSALEVENYQLKQQKDAVPRLQAELSRYRKQTQEMLVDMKDLESKLEAKAKTIAEYQNNPHQSSESLKMVERELETIMRQKSDLVNSYEGRLLEKEKKISHLQAKLYESQSNNPKLIGLEAGEATFEQILRQQLQEINTLKRANSQKINEVFSLKLEMENMRSELQNETNKTKILSMQAESQEKNSNSVIESQLRAARNEIESLQRRIESMNSSLESKRKQNQNKDEFIRQFLLGLNKQHDAAVLLAKLESVLAPSRQL